MKLLKTIFLILLAYNAFAEVPTIPSEGSVNQYISASRLYLCRKDFGASEEMALKAVKLAEALPKNKYFQARAYGNLGLVLIEEDKTVGAHTYLTTAKKIWDEIGFADKYSYPSYVCVEQALWELNKIEAGDFTNEFRGKFHTDKPNLDEVLTASDFYRLRDDFKSATDFAKFANAWAENKKEVNLLSRTNGHLGILYAKNGTDKDADKARTHLQKSIQLFYQNAIGSPEIRPVEQTLLELEEKYQIKPSSNSPPTGLYGGIEVGAKGVKLSITRLSTDIEGNYDYEVVKDSAINTSITSFIPSAVDETAQAVVDLYNYANSRFSIDKSKIYLAVSSGVQERAEKDKKSSLLEELSNKIKNKLSEPDKNILFITAREEARLTHIGIIKKADRERAMIVDVGSGNTKGGFFNIGLTEFYNFSFNYGTQSLADEVNKELVQSSIDTYLSGLETKLKTIKNELIKPKLNAKSTLRDRPLIVLSGGICWAIATIMHPESIERTFVEMTLEDVTQFKDKAISNYQQLKDPKQGLYKIQGQKSKDKYTKDAIRVANTFGQLELIAGASLLEVLMQEFNTSTVKKGYYLSHDGYIGWITGLIIKSEVPGDK